MGQIARQEGLSVRGARLLVERLLRSREVDPAPGFVQTQIGRLNDAMMIAHSAMMSGNLQALDRVIRLVREFERYHGVLTRAGGFPGDGPRPARRGLRAARAARARRKGTNRHHKSLKRLSRVQKWRRPNKDRLRR